MFVRIQTRFLILISVFAVLFLSALLVSWHSERAGTRATLAELQLDRGRLMERVMRLASRPLSLYAYDYSYWDEMYEFVDTGDRAWAEENLDATLTSFEASAAWVYRRDLTCVYSVNDLRNDSLAELPVPRHALDSLIAAHWFTRFFVQTAAGIMEIHGAPIQPGEDVKRITEPHGFFFVGRLWTDERLRYLGLSTGSMIALVSPEAGLTDSFDPQTYTVTNIVPLRSWDGRPLAAISATSSFPGMRNADLERRRHFVATVFFVLGVTVAISLFLFRHVSNPLRALSASLKSHDPSLIRSVEKCETEFARIAGLIVEFFRQESALEAEIEQRKRSEDALRDSEKRFRDLADLLPLTIFETDAAGNLTYLNRHGAEEFQLDREALPAGTNLLNFVAPEDVLRAAEALREMAEGIRPRLNLSEFNAVRGDGSRLTVMADVTPIIRDGQVYGVRGFAMDISERKHAAEAARTADHQRQLILECAAEGIFGLDPNGNHTFVNPAAARLLGHEPSDLIGRNSHSTWHHMRPDGSAYPADECPIYRALHSGNSYHGHEHFIRKDGTVFPVEFTVMPIREGGQTVGSVVTFRDVSDRLKVEHALRDSEERFRNLADTAPVLIWMAGLDRHCYYFNKSWLTFRGRSLQQEYGKGWQEGLHPDDAAMCLESYRRAFAARRPFSIEYRLRAADGSYRWVLDRGAPRYTADGGFAGYIGTCTDISDRRAAEEALREQKERAQTYLNIVGATVLALDANGTITLINQAGCRLLGGTEEQICGKNWFDTFVPAHSRGEVRHVFEQIVSGELAPVEYYENTILTLRGAERVVAWHNTVLRDENGRITGTLSAGQDITERRLAEKRAEEWNRRFELAVAASDQVVYEDDCLNGVVMWSGSVEKVLGYAQREISETNAEWLERIHPDDLAEVNRRLQEARAVAGPYDLQYRYRRQDGRYIWVRDRGFYVADATGRIIRALGIMSDISERLAAEQQLAEWNRRFELVVASFGQVVYDYDIPTGKILWSGSIEHVLGYPHGTMTDDINEWAEKIHPEDRAEALRQLEIAQNECRPYDVEYRFRKADGSYLWMHDRGFFVADASGKVVRMLGSMSDISERKQAESSLRETAAAACALVEAVRQSPPPALCSHHLEALQSEIMESLDRARVRLESATRHKWE